MSFVVVTSLLIHSLRLGYLRNVSEDPYGPRLISFNPSFSTNQYISAASLADATKWPELSAPHSPPLSPDETDGGLAARPRSISGFPGATGLKYTRTILGPSRTGALGMSVSGRRRAGSKLAQSVVSQEEDVRGDAAGTAGTTLGSASGGTTTGTASTASTTATTTPATAMAAIASRSPPRVVVDQQQHSAGADLPALKPSFVPKFKGAAEMDERRRLRLQARRGAAAAAAAAAAVAAGAAAMSPPEVRVVASSEKGAGALELMSSGSEEVEEEDQEDEEDSFLRVEDEDVFDDVVDVGVSGDIDEDEFDP